MLIHQYWQKSSTMSGNENRKWYLSFYQRPFPRARIKTRVHPRHVRDKRGRGWSCRTGPFPLSPRKDRTHDALKMLDLLPHTSPSCEESCLQRMTLLNKNPSELPERAWVARWPVDARTRLRSHTHAPMMTTAWAQFVQNLLLGKPLLSLEQDDMSACAQFLYQGRVKHTFICSILAFNWLVTSAALFQLSAPLPLLPAAAPPAAEECSPE